MNVLHVEGFLAVSWNIDRLHVICVLWICFKDSHLHFERVAVAIDNNDMSARCIVGENVKVDQQT